MLAREVGTRLKFAFEMTFYKNEKEKEEETDKKHDVEDAKIRRMFRKPTTPMPIFALKRKDPFVPSSGLSTHP